MSETLHIPEWVDVAVNGVGTGYEDDVLLDSELQGIMGNLPPSPSVVFIYTNTYVIYKRCCEF